MRRAAAPVLLAALLLSACAVGPDFHRPAAPRSSGYAPGALPASTSGAQTAGGVAQRLLTGADIPGQWWTLFHSAPLDTLVGAALAANPTLQAAKAALRQARSQLYAGEGALYPSISGSGSITREKVSGAQLGQPGVSQIFTLNTASVSVSYLLDIWGGTRRQIESLAAQVDYQRFELEAAYLTLTSNVVAATIREASLRGQIAATEQIVSIESQQLAGQQREFASGAAADTAVLAQAAALAQARAQLAPLRKQLAMTRHQLIAYLGRLPDQALGASFNLASLQLPSALPVSLPSRLVEQRPDVRAAEAQLHAASAQIGVATSNMLPQISLSGAFGREGVGGLLGAGTSVWNVAAGLTLPLFEGRKLAFERRAAIAAYQQSAAQYRQTVVGAFQDVADALSTLQLDADELNAEASAERAAADSLAASQRQYRVGAISYLALLSAEQAYQQALLGLVQAQAARYSDSAALLAALGGGWWNRGDVASQ